MQMLKITKQLRMSEQRPQNFRMARAYKELYTCVEVCMPKSVCNKRSSG